MSINGCALYSLRSQDDCSYLEQLLSLPWHYYHTQDLTNFCTKYDIIAY